MARTLRAAYGRPDLFLTNRSNPPVATTYFFLGRFHCTASVYVTDPGFHICWGRRWMRTVHGAHASRGLRRPDLLPANRSNPSVAIPVPYPSQTGRRDEVVSQRTCRPSSQLTFLSHFGIVPRKGNRMESAHGAAIPPQSCLETTEQCEHLRRREPTKPHRYGRQGRFHRSLRKTEIVLCAVHDGTPDRVGDSCNR